MLLTMGYYKAFEEYHIYVPPLRSACAVEIGRRRKLGRRLPHWRIWSCWITWARRQRRCTLMHMRAGNNLTPRPSAPAQASSSQQRSRSGPATFIILSLRCISSSSRIACCPWFWSGFPDVPTPLQTATVRVHSAVQISDDHHQQPDRVTGYMPTRRGAPNIRRGQLHPVDHDPQLLCRTRQPGIVTRDLNPLALLSEELHQKPPR